MSSTQGARKFPANISFTNTLTPQAWSQTPPAGGTTTSFSNPTLTTISGTTTASLNLSGLLTSWPPNPVYTASGSYITLTSRSNEAIRAPIVYQSGGASPSYMNTMQGILGIPLTILGTSFTAANTPEFLTFTLPFAAQESTTLRIDGSTTISYFGTTLPSASLTIPNPIYVSPSTTLTWSNITIPAGAAGNGPLKYVDIPIRSVADSRINMSAYISNPGGNDSYSTVNGTLTLSKTAWNLTSGGTRYVVGNNFRIDGTYFGGTSPANDITVSVTAVNSYGAITNFTVDGTMPIFPIYKPVILDFVDSANYIRDASELTTTNREVSIYNEKRSGSTIQGQGKVEISQGNQFRTSYLFGQLKSGAGFGGVFNTNGISYKPESSFNPSMVSIASISGLALWLDASDSSSVTLSGATNFVTRWSDKSGNGNHAVQSDSLKRPQYRENGIYFTATASSNTNVLSIANLNLVSNVPYFGAFAVFNLLQPQTQNTNRANVFFAFAGANYHFQVSISDAVGSGGSRPRTGLFLSNPDGINITTNDDTNEYSIGKRHVLFGEGNYVSKDVGLYTDGARRGTSTFNNNGTRSPSGPASFVNIGGAGLYTQSLNNAYIHEFILFRSPITTAQRQQIEGYLSYKWGLEGGLVPSHPYYIAPTPVAPPAFVPTQFSGLTLWLDGADATTITGTSNVTQWRDKSTSLAHFNTVSGAPTYTSSTEGVVFNHPDVMRTSISGTYTPGVSSLFVVTNVTGAGPGNYSYVFSVGTNGDISIRYDTTTPGSHGSLLDLNSMYLNGRQINIGLPSGILNNKSVINGTIAATTGGSPMPITLMQLGTSFMNRGLVGSIQEVLLYSSALTSGQRIQVEEYLKAKWGVVTLSPDTVPGLNLWLDASDKSTLFTDAAGTTPVSFTSQSVALWKDKSATGNNATLPTSTAAPYNSGAVAIYNDNNALPTLRFSGRNGYNLNPSLVPNGSSPATYFFVMNVLAGNNQEQTALITGTYGGGQGRRFHVNNGSFRAGLVNQSTADHNQSLYNSSAYPIASVTMSTTSISGWNNGTSFSTNISGNALSSGTAIAQIGYLAEFPLVGNISEMLIYNGQLTTAQRQYIEGYLATKWGSRSSLVAGHPYNIPSPNGVIARPTFVPTSISGCALWLDAADASRITRTGVNVSGWRDKSGNGVDMVYDTTTAGPLIYNSAGFNNSPSITFSTSASGRSALVRSSGISLSGTASLSIYTVLNPSTNSALFPRILSFLSGDDFSGGTSSGFNIGLTNPTGTASLILRKPPDSFTYSVGLANTNVISSVIFNSNVSQNAAVPLNRNGISINGNAFETVSGSGSNFRDYSLFRIGGGPNSGDIFSGNISEILIFRRALTLPEHQQIEGYLAWKWGLQTKLLTTHPYYISAPSGGTAFLPTMVAGTPPIMWLDASDRDAITLSGSSVTKWWDKSGTGNNLVNASGYQIPNYNVSGMNGSPTVSFFRNSASSFSVLQNTAFSGLSGQASMTLMFVAQRNGSDTGYQRFFAAASSISGEDYSNTSSFAVNSGISNGDLRFERNSLNITQPFTTTNAFLGEVIVNGTASAVDRYAPLTNYLYANGQLLNSSGGVAAGSTFNIAHVRLGASTASIPSNDFVNNSLQGNMSEILLFNRALTTIESQQLEGYLAWKWGLQKSLPANHPNLYFPPVASPITTPFSPASIVTPALWLDAFDTSTITISGSNVTGWRDKSSSARALTPSSLTAFQYANTFNGSLPSVFGSNTGSSATIASIAGFTLNTPANIFAVFQNTNGSSGFPYIFNITAGSNRAYMLSTSGNLRVSSGVGSANTGGSVGLSTNTNQIITMATGASSTLVYQNGGVNGAGSTVSPSSTINVSGATVTSSNLTIGGNATNEAWTGHFCEIIIVNTSLTDAQRQRIEGYLAWKWNLVGSLPTNHPHYSLKP